MLSQLVAYSIDVEAFNVDRVLISRLPTRDDVIRRREQLAAFGGVGGLRDTMEYGYLVSALHQMQLLERESRGSVACGTVGSPLPSHSRYVDDINVRRIDLEFCCRTINRFFDRAVAAVGLPLTERHAELRQIDNELNAMQAKPATNPFFVSEARLANQAILDSLYGFERHAEEHKANVSRYRLLDVLCSARLFELEHGRPATSREDLVPEYLQVWPTDEITGDELRKFQSDGKWVIYFDDPNEIRWPDNPEISRYASIAIGL